MHTVGRGGGGVVACDIFLIGGQPCVTVCDRGEGLNLVKKSVTYFSNGPKLKIN